MMACFHTWKSRNHVGVEGSTPTQACDEKSVIWKDPFYVSPQQGGRQSDNADPGRHLLIRLL